ncbi:MAG TPA: hypothetical protein VM221_09045 [Armatimonadota bacterium]|nr:hypothetical protein [Armatimonadota bacterium]
MHARIHNWAARRGEPGLAFALLVVTLLLGTGRHAQALTVPADSGPSSGYLLPLTVVDEHPDPLAPTRDSAWSVFGGQMDLSLSAASRLSGGAYFNRPASVFGAQPEGDPFGWSASALMPLRGTGAGDLMGRARALQEHLSYATGGLELAGSYTDVDPEFRAPGAGAVSFVGDRSGADGLAAVRGMRDLQLQARYRASDALQLNYSHSQKVNQRDGDKEQGLTRDITKGEAVYQLSARTRVDFKLDQAREEWDRGGRLEVTDKQVREYALRHDFGGGTRASVVRNLTSLASGGSPTDTDTTQVHFEHAPGARLSLVGDWMDRGYGDGKTEATTQLALKSIVGAGRTKTTLKGLYKQQAQGQGNLQADTLYQLGLTVAPSPLAQFSAGYESLQQQGPQADHDFVRTRLGFSSRLAPYASLTADYARETDKGMETKLDHGLKLQLNPGPLTLATGVSVQQGTAQPDLATTFGHLQIKLGRPLTAWARALTAADPVPGAGVYGLRSTPEWASLGDGAVALSLIGRSGEDPNQAATRSLAYQTMIGGRGYLKLTSHVNPMLKQDSKLVMREARLDLYEGGFDLGGGFGALGRFTREHDLKPGGAQAARTFALRGGVGGNRLTFVGGVQTLEVDDGAATDWRFGSLNLKLGRPLADWAKAADTGLFDDNVKYGYRKLPTWVSFGDGGLSLCYMERQAIAGDKLIASAVGYQTMLGGRTYARLSFQQNPLTDDKQKVLAVDRKLIEVGHRFGGKFAALARYVTEDSLAEVKSLRSSMLGLRGRLSQRERLETVIVLDDMLAPGGRYRTATYGLEYAREAGEGHYLILKGTLTHGDAPGGAAGAPATYQVDLAYRHAM